MKENWCTASFIWTWQRPSLLCVWLEEVAQRRCRISLTEDTVWTHGDDLSWAGRLDQKTCSGDTVKKIIQEYEIYDFNVILMWVHHCRWTTIWIKMNLCIRIHLSYLIALKRHIISLFVVFLKVRNQGNFWVKTVSKFKINFPYP